MFWYSHLFQNFPQFVVFHTVKGFGTVNKVELDVFSGTLLINKISCYVSLKKNLLGEGWGTGKKGIKRLKIVVKK